MLRSNILNSLVISACVALTACSFEDKAQHKDASSSRTTDGDDHDHHDHDKPVKKDKGRVSLRTPKQDSDRPFTILEVSLRQDTCWSKPQPEPMPMPEPMPGDDSADGEGGDGGGSSDGEEAVDAVPPQEVAPSAIPPEYYDQECESSSQDYSFAFNEGEVVSIDDLEPGEYLVSVRLINESGIAEQGDAWIYVQPGIVTNAAVEVYPTDGAGRLDLEIIRGGERPGEEYGECGTDSSDSVAISESEG